MKNLCHTVRAGFGMVAAFANECGESYSSYSYQSSAQSVGSQWSVRQLGGGSWADHDGAGARSGGGVHGESREGAALRQ